MSDQEIQAKINRMRLEDTYASMIASRAPKEKVSRGKRFVSNLKRNVITPALTDAGRTLLGNLIKKKVMILFMEIINLIQQKNMKRRLRN